LSQKIKKLSLIFSFYNEEECINASISELESVLGNIEYIDYELIFVNDHSSDNSLKLLLEARKNNNKIKIINLSRRFGVYPGIMAGIKSCTGDALIYMDIDLQDPPELIPEMVKLWIEDEYDVIITTRSKREGENILKIFISYIAYLFLKNTVSIDIFRNSGDFRLISRRVINKYINFVEIEPFFRFLVDWIGFKRKQIFYVRRPRNYGKSKFPFGFKKINQYFDVFLTPFSDFPLKFIFFTGLIIMIFSSIFSFYLAFNSKSIFEIVLILIVGLQSFFLGLLSIYIGSVFKESKKRPLYIIENKVGF
tara:strand:+ start:638 stop:1561 length:924 start_codon:yes stop_codon:yes gene_type:complete